MIRHGASNSDHVPVDWEGILSLGFVHRSTFLHYIFVYLISLSGVIRKLAGFVIRLTDLESFA